MHRQLRDAVGTTDHNSGGKPDYHPDDDARARLEEAQEAAIPDDEDPDLMQDGKAQSPAMLPGTYAPNSCLESSTFALKLRESFKQLG